jgi:uncharacterized protein YbjT (DUF2867 family)
MGKILVTGATGTIGHQVVRALKARGTEVRAAVHSPAKAATLSGAGAEVVVFDLTDPATVRVAMVGVERVFFLSPFVEEFVAPFRGALEAAREAGVRHAVRVSAIGANAQGKVALTRHHGEADGMLAGSGLSWTVLQPNFFQDNLLNFHATTIRERGVFYGASGTGRTSYVSSADIAGCAATVLCDPERHNGNTYALTGPEALTADEVAAVASEVTGRPIRYIDVSPEDLAAGMLGAGTPEWMVRDLVALEAVKANGWAAAVSGDVPRLLGRPAESYRGFLDRNRSRLA